MIHAHAHTHTMHKLCPQLFSYKKYLTKIMTICLCWQSKMTANIAAFVVAKIQIIFRRVVRVAATSSFLRVLFCVAQISVAGGAFHSFCYKLVACHYSSNNSKVLLNWLYNPACSAEVGTCKWSTIMSYDFRLGLAETVFSSVISSTHHKKDFVNFRHPQRFIS